MIIYFADREMQVLGHATTNLQKGYVISDDLKTEDVESGVSSFSCRIGFNKQNRKALENMTNAGNYLLRSNDGENEFYTIIDTEIDTKNQDIYVYAEDAGLDLINEIAGEFEATESYTAEWYINKYILDSGFEIGINEIPASSKRKLSWEGEETVTARLASIATQFDDYEISYSFAIKGLIITNKYINIHKKRGKDDGVQLRLNMEVDRIVTTKSVANLATAFVCEGGVPDKEENPITFSSKNYKYDDGDFFVDGDKLKSRKANEKWSRYVWNKEPNRLKGYEGYIVRPYSYDTTDPDTLRAHAMTELKKVCDIEVNYEIDINRLPEGVKIGDRINIIDDAGGTYVSTRVLLLETSVVDKKYTATLGEHIIKKSGISQKVADLAAKFAANSTTATKALSVANAAKTSAEEAKTQAETAVQGAEEASNVAEEAKNAAVAATESASNAQTEALAAQEAVEKVESSVSSMETTVANAKAAADNAKKAADTATAKAAEAATAAKDAQDEAEAAQIAAANAKESADSTASKAAEAKSIAESAKIKAQDAYETAEAAKLDAEQAERDIEKWADNLETVTDTMKADYARKTDLTETEAHLQAQISRNAAGVSSTVSMLKTVDETANDAREKLAAAQAEAAAAQSKAAEATAAATAAQTQANNAARAATTAQTQANNAKAAYETARSVADQAEAELEAAKVDLATIQARIDATEEEIAEAQNAVETAETTASTAKATADAAKATADAAAELAATKASAAWSAKVAADNAKADADIATELAEKANSAVEAAQTESDNADTTADQATAAADEAQRIADEAQSAANTAVETAETARNTAEAAVAESEAAQQTAEIAARIASQAKADLETAQARLTKVQADAEATEEEVTAAEADVATAQAAANTAETEAATAQTAANEAKANAEAAQAAAEEAAQEAKDAQNAAEAAQDTADIAKQAVDGLAVRVTKAETKITQKAKEITLHVSELEEETTANGKRITKAESQIQMLTDSISSLVRGEGGGSLIRQDATGAYWFDISGILQDVEDATSSVDIMNALTEELKARTEYVRSYTDENGQPCIELGDNNPSNNTGEKGNFIVRITNTEIQFEEDGTIPARINRKMLIIEKTLIKNELQFGDDEDEDITGVWIWKRRSNGNLGLSWKGVSK